MQIKQVLIDTIWTHQENWNALLLQTELNIHNNKKYLELTGYSDHEVCKVPTVCGF